MTETTTTDIAAALAEQRAAAAELERKAAEAERLRGVSDDLRTDIARFTLRVQRLRAIGTGHIERKQEAHDQNLGMIEYEPLRSKMTGHQLADEAQKAVDERQAALDANEQEIARLLAPPGR